ncbi:M3 family oligoendopeptidase [Candidatus Stoquefichus sp. SB1]|uniref:M3 family oligoendopeptidase n=1 Tax=Candidatus Stoquefichus sp. SB1 TaxID=1658109 RepID=UPI00067E783F|nr:M3 family oligoendopeptidase [Candidatus Stoquefichus sp. SB1]
MDRKWSLKELYTSFQDEDFLNDLKQIELILTDMKKYPACMQTEDNLVAYLKQENILDDLVEKVYAFISLIMNADTNNLDALKYASVIENLLASFADTSAKIQKWIAKFDLSKIDNEDIKNHLFVLNEIKQQNQYLLDDQSESVLANMKTTGSSAWLKYKDQLISSLMITMDDKTYPLTEILNMAYSKDKEIRKKAYEAEIAAYQNIELGIASALNAIKGEAITVAKLRGYHSVLERTLIDSRMSQKTLDVLLKTMKKALPMFEKYFQTKAKHLGYENGLPWYDMYAPIVDVNSEYNYEKGSQFVIEQFSSFSQNLGDYAKMAIEKNWIDVYPRQGKVGGAFCHNLHCIQESRFLLNYGNDFSDVITMAHELGHGFHGHCLNSQTALNAQYPMPIAETASTFCETIVKKAALKNASKAEQLMILENELSDCAQVIVDIYSRFLFESRLIEKREEGPLSVDEIKSLMIEAQKEAYGQGLDHETLHPYMWTWKPHYYEADYAFYNFPYAFGLLLAKGLYGLYLKEGASFAKTYENFLSLTGKMNLEDVGKSVGIDLTSEEFWQNSLDMIKEDLELFYELLS